MYTGSSIWTQNVIVENDTSIWIRVRLYGHCIVHKIMCARPTSNEMVKNKCRSHFIARIINLSLTTGKFPSSQKTAIITKFLTKASPDPESLKKYRSVSNLTFVAWHIDLYRSFRFWVMAMFCQNNIFLLICFLTLIGNTTSNQYKYKILDISEFYFVFKKTIKFKWFKPFVK